MQRTLRDRNKQGTLYRADNILISQDFICNRRDTMLQDDDMSNSFGDSFDSLESRHLLMIENECGDHVFSEHAGSVQVTGNVKARL